MPQNNCSVELCLSYLAQIQENLAAYGWWFFTVMWNCRPRDLKNSGLESDVRVVLIRHIKETRMDAAII